MELGLRSGLGDGGRSRSTPLQIKPSGCSAEYRGLRDPVDVAAAIPPRIGVFIVFVLFKGFGSDLLDGTKLRLLVGHRVHGVAVVD